MNSRDRLVVVMAAIYVPQVAAKIVASLGASGSEHEELAAALATATRAKRLQALGDALLESRRELIVLTPSAESGRIAALCRGDPLPSIRPVSPIIRRICRELRVGDPPIANSNECPRATVRPRADRSFTRPDRHREAPDSKHQVGWHSP